MVSGIIGVRVTDKERQDLQKALEKDRDSRSLSEMIRRSLVTTGLMREDKTGTVQRKHAPQRKGA